MSAVILLRTFEGFDCKEDIREIIPTLAITLDFSLKNTLFDMVLFVKILIIQVIRSVLKSFVAIM